MSLIDLFFEYPYKEGYTRVEDNGKLIYVETKQLRKLLLEDLETVKYARLSNES